MSNKLKRSYSPTTYKVLFGACGNQCAEPDCTNPVIEPGTPHDDAAVAAQICHIYSISGNGPRAKPSLTEEELNAPSNLILLCGHHHPIVDKQEDTYPAEMLFEWKRKHEAKFQQGTAEAIKEQGAAQRLTFTQGLTDKEIEAEVERIRKSRFLTSFPTREASIALANRVERTELSGGSSETRAKALAWCARLFVSFDDTRPRAPELLAKSRELAPTSEADLAEAFITARDNKSLALKQLAAKNTPAAFSAALRIVINADQAAGAIAWVNAAQLNVDSFDADGKLAYLMNQAGEGEWDVAFTEAEKITEADIVESPVLLHALATISLAQAVPDEFRAVATMQVPFEVMDFPLAADAKALAARRRAASYYERLAEFARSVGLTGAAYQADDYVMWLRLRDSETRLAALEALRTDMRDPNQSLRRLHMAMQFGINVDLGAAEREVDRRMALSGTGTPDEACARLAIAFAQEGPKGVAAYIAKHRAQLFEHLNKPAILSIEIQMLARAGQADAAKERLAEAIADGLVGGDQDRLERMISEAEGADPAAERKRLYEKTQSLADLANLVHFLDEKEAWAELHPTAEKLFNLTRSLDHAFLVAKALDRSAQFAQLHSFLLQNQVLVDQSLSLKAMMVWSYFREGRFAEASALLSELSAKRDHPGDRTLRVNLAVASGNWDDLIQYAADEWAKRETRSAPELLIAGQMDQAAGGVHAEQLIRAAVAKSPDDPKILTAAYFHAVSAGWEDNADVGQWVVRAADLSGEDGPMRKVSMTDIIEQKPSWDQFATNVSLQLNEGKIPAFGAAYMLNRSFIDLALLQSLADLSEADPRRRGIVYAFSGARPAESSGEPKTIALDLAAIFTLTRLDLLSTVINSYDLVVIPAPTLGWLFQERQKASFHQPSRIRDAHERRLFVGNGALKVVPSPSPLDIHLAREVGLGLAGLLQTVKSKSASEDGVARYVVRSSPVHRVGSVMQEEAELSAYAGCLCSCQAVIEKLRERGMLTLAQYQQGLSYLRLHEKRWPDEPAIADGAELYLDELSITYLQSVGVLGKLKNAGFTAFIPEEEDQDANRLIRFEHLSGEQLRVIETIRKTLAEGLKTGRVRAVRSHAEGEETDQALKTHPTFGVLELVEPVDAFVVDDRFINSHLHLDSPDKRTPIFSTLDLLDNLAKRHVISREDVFAHRIYLRQAGFQLIPVVVDELTHHLRNAHYDGQKITETAELRAVRESLLKARMSKVLQLPKEALWLHQTMTAIIKTIKAMWRECNDNALAAAYAEWLLGLLDVRGWAPSTQPGNERNFVLLVYAGHILGLVFPPDDISDATKKAYEDWLDNRIFEGIRDTEPEAFAWLVKRARGLIAHAAEDAVKEFGT